MATCKYELLTQAVLHALVDPKSQSLRTWNSNPVRLEKLCKTTLRKGQKILNNDGRALVSRRLFGVCSLRRRLLYMLRWALLSDDVTNNGEVAPIAPDSVPKCSDCAMNSASDVPDSWNSENVSPSQHQHNSTNFRVSSVFGCAQDEALVAQSKQPILSDGGHSQEKARSDYVELSPKDVVVCLLTMYVVHEEHARFEGNLSVSAEETSEWIEYAKRHLDCKEPEQLIARLQRAEPSRINWPPSDTTAYTAVYYSLPDWLVSQIVDTKGTASTNEIAAAMNRPGGIKLRCNTYMNDIPKLMDDLQAEEGIVTSPTRYTACGLKVDSPAKPQIVGTEIFKRGVYEVQDEGSQLIGLATGVERGMSVVDLCCGRGGKALHLADLLSRCRRPGVRQPFRSVNRGRKRVYSGDSDIPTGTSAREVDSGGCSFIERMVVDTNVHTRTTDDDVDSIVAEISVGACNTRTLCSLALCDTLKTGETHSAAPSTETDQSEALSVPGLLVCHDIDDTTLSVARRRLTSRPGAVDPMVGCGFVCSRAARQIVGGRGGDTARGRGGVGMDGVSEAHGRRDADVTAPTTHLGLETGANASTALHVDPRLARGVSTQTEGQVLVADTTVSVAEAADAYVDIPAIRANLMDNYTGIQDTHSPSPYADVVLVDAPCSSLGTLRRGPNVRWEMSQDSLALYPPLQRRLLAYGATLVKVGGVLVYATCTFNRSECSDIDNWFNLHACRHSPVLHTDGTPSLASAPDNNSSHASPNTMENAVWFLDELSGTRVCFEPSPLSLAWGSELADKLGISQSAASIQLCPHANDTDGFFIARWRRTA